MSDTGNRGKFDRDYIANAPVIRRLRSKSKLTLKGLERVSGINFTTLSRIEGGKNKSPHWDTLDKIADALKVEVDVIVIYPDLPLDSPYDTDENIKKIEEQRDEFKKRSDEKREQGDSEDGGGDPAT